MYIHNKTNLIPIDRIVNPHKCIMPMNVDVFAIILKTKRSVKGNKKHECGIRRPVRVDVLKNKNVLQDISSILIRVCKYFHQK